MDLKTFLTRWDNGSGWDAFEGDREIEASEVIAGGGYDTLAADFGQLSEADQALARAALSRSEVRDELERRRDPAVRNLVREVDKGTSSWGWTSGAGDWSLGKDELASHGFSGFVDKLAALTPAQQGRLASLLSRDVLRSDQGQELARRLPHLFDGRNFGSALFRVDAEHRAAESGRAFLRDKLGINPFTITDGLRVEHLRALPTRAAATPEEQLVVDLRRELAGGRSMDVLAFSRFVAANYPRTPRLSAAELGAALTQDGARFEGKKVTVTGYAQHVSTNRSSELVYTYTYDVLEGKWDWKFVNKPVVETVHHLYDNPNHTGPAVRVFDRDEASAFFSVGVGGFGFSLASASGKSLDNRSYEATGTIRRRRDGTRELVLRDVKTK